MERLKEGPGEDKLDLLVCVYVCGGVFGYCSERGVWLRALTSFWSSQTEWVWVCLS